MDYPFFTHPPFARPSSTDLATEDLPSLLLQRGNNRFLLCWHSQCLVLEDEGSTLGGSSTIPKKSLSIFMLDGQDLLQLLSSSDDDKGALMILLGIRDYWYYVCDVSYMSEEHLLKLLPSTVWFADLRAIANRLKSANGDAAVLSIAQALCRYHRHSVYCSRCGKPTSLAKHGTCRKCHGCGSTEFPRQDPAMIVLVHCDAYCLLGRKSIWPEGRYSCLAGFTEIGESMEETV